MQTLFVDLTRPRRSTAYAPQVLLLLISRLKVVAREVPEHGFDLLFRQRVELLQKLPLFNLLLLGLEPDDCLGQFGGRGALEDFAQRHLDPERLARPRDELRGE